MTNPRGTARLVVTLVGWIAALGCGPSSPTDEEVHLKMSGSCSPELREFDMHRYQYLLEISYPDAGLATPFPSRGAIDQMGHPIREGGWQLWGCMTGREPCFDNFRRCTARRDAWQLDVTCLDGSGAPICQAVLTE